VLSFPNKQNNSQVSWVVSKLLHHAYLVSI
jgi:hypothetical protein